MHQIHKPKNFFLLNIFKVEFILETLNIFKCSTLPLADLYNNLLSEGKCLSLTINPSMLNEAALLIIDPIFLASVTSSKQTKFKLFFDLINSLREISSLCSISATKP